MVKSPNVVEMSKETKNKSGLRYLGISSILCSDQGACTFTKRSNIEYFIP